MRTVTGRTDRQQLLRIYLRNGGDGEEKFAKLWQYEYPTLKRGEFAGWDGIHPEDQSLERFRIKPKNALGARWGAAFTLYEDLCRESGLEEVANQIRRIVKEIEVARANESDARTYLEELGNYAKHEGEASRFGRNWRYFVDLATFGLFQHPTTMELDVKAKLEQMISGSAPIASSKMYPWIVENVSRAAELVLKRGKWLKADDLSIDEFITDPARWGKSGASGETASELFDVKVDIRPTKWAQALKSVPELRRKFLSTNRGLAAKVVIKREAMKLRPVILVGMGSYLRESYLWHFIEPMVYGNRGAPLWGNAEYQVQELESICDYILKYVNVPIDIDKFDWNYDKLLEVKVTVVLYHLVLEHYKDSSSYNDIKKAFDLEIEAVVKDQSVRYVDENGNMQHIKWEKGLLSGRRWTSFLGTLMNMIYSELVVMFRDIRLAQNKSAGDDKVASFHDLNTAMIFLGTYDLFKIPYNPRKFFISEPGARGRTEFLRMVYDSGGSKGYPARAVTSVLMANPISRGGNITLRDKINQKFATWGKLCGRIKADFVSKMAYDDVSRVAGSKIGHILWHIPVTYGGGGISPFVAKRVIYDTDEKIEMKLDYPAPTHFPFDRGEKWVRQWFNQRLTPKATPKYAQMTVRVVEAELPNDTYMTRVGKMTYPRIQPKHDTVKNLTMFEIEKLIAADSDEPVQNLLSLYGEGSWSWNVRILNNLKSKRLRLEFMLKGISGSVARITGISELQLSRISSRLFNSQFWRTMSHGVTKRKVELLSVAAERATYSYARTARVVLGA